MTIPLATLPTLETAQKLGLLPEEYRHICDLMGRQPNFTELSVYSVLWSEHCSYKNSILWLKKLPKAGARVLAAAGEENAGLLDIGDGLAVCFKIESHNHPSAIEPYQGAATGVGGIHRDIFTMGARPIATLNSLRFGDPTTARTQYLLKGVVRGIGDYGNAFGVPTVGGEIYFDPCYTVNPLVNAMSVGIVKIGDSASATAKGPGNPVFIVGSATGKDGIHGATFASEDIGEKSSEKLPSVQVGDPFTEKLLLEATLEALRTGQVVGLQDMGAAGIACSTSEMSARGGVGMDIDLSKVPLRQPNMQPFEILLSESQERMLLVVKKGGEAAVQAVFDKWDLQCAEIGEVTAGGELRYFWQGDLAASVNAESLVLGGGAPVYTREYRIPAYQAEVAKFTIASVPEPVDYAEVLRSLLASPNICSRRWVRRQYDSTVGAATLTGNAITDAGVVHIHGTHKAIAMTTDCNGRYVYADPRRGCALAVAEAARNLACAGAQPLGVTNCLNFGNPYDTGVYWQFTEAILGMKDACEAFSLPVTGGNVSFYNQRAEGGAVFPTPTIGMVGLIHDVRQPRPGIAFQREGDKLYLLGQPATEAGSSEYIAHYHKIEYSPAPSLDLGLELLLQQTLLKAIGDGVLTSAHDVSDGGLLVCLAESSFANGLGFRVNTPNGLRKDVTLFGESGGQVVVSVSSENTRAFEKLLATTALPCQQIGEVSGAHIVVDGSSLGEIVALKTIYDTALEQMLGEG